MKKTIFLGPTIFMIELKIIELVEFWEKVLKIHFSENFKIFRNLRNYSTYFIKNTYTYMYIFLYLWIYKYRSIYTHICIYIYMHIHTYIHTYMYVYMLSIFLPLYFLSLYLLIFLSLHTSIYISLYIQLLYNFYVFYVKNWDKKEFLIKNGLKLCIFCNKNVFFDLFLQM